MSSLPVVYWLYLTALVLGAVLSVIASLDGAPLESDADGAGEAEAQHESDVEVTPFWALLGVGRVPLGSLLTLDLLAFGGVGVVASELMRSSLPLGLASTWALPLALVLGPLLGGRLAAAVSRWLPPIESYGASRQELVGRLGYAELPIDGQFVRVRVRDDGGAEHLLLCVTTGAPLSRGAEVVITDVDPKTGIYTIVPADLQLIRNPSRE